MLSSRIRMKLLLAFLFSLLLTSCAPEPEPILDEGTVIAKNASLRMKNSSTSRTIKLLVRGDGVDVLEGKDNWYRVRYGSDVEGWMEESTVVKNQTRDRIKKMVAESKNLEPQNTAVTKQDVNLR